MAQLLRELISSPEDASCVPWLHTMTQILVTLWSGNKNFV